ncbi:MAG: GNAT family N-acetyltransferase [Saprospiraceae bacterium]
MTQSVISSQRYEYPLKEKACRCALHSSIEEVAEEWDWIAPKHNLFLQSTYLRIVEKNPPKGMQFAYLLFYRDNTPIGICYFQIKHFKADQSLNTPTKGEDKPPCFFNTIGRYLKGLVASKVEFNTLVCGNLLLTGAHGFYFDPEKVDGEASLRLIDEAIDNLYGEFEKRKLPIAGTLMKDFSASEHTFYQQFSTKHEFNEFTIQPSMIFDLPESWNNFDDYLGAMSSKYRVRAKRAFKKGKEVEKRELDLAAIEANLPRIYELYQNIAENAGFNMVDLNEDYLLNLKRNLPDQFTMMGYYLEDKLIAFFTTIHNGSELEAHFLGFEKHYNRSIQVYLNILYDIVRIGLEKQVKTIVFARTALEIKSSVGAVAEEMYCYMKHRSAFSNKFLQPLLGYLRPKEEWVPRSPFKTKEPNQEGGDS